MRVLAAGVAAVGIALFAAPAHAVEPYDFNGDGRQDLAVGTTDGVVVVQTGRRGLRVHGARVLEGADQRELASADFDGDGMADLATVIADEARIFYGSAGGLDPDRSAGWTEPETKVISVAADDVDGDGYGDLAAMTFGPDPNVPAGPYRIRTTLAIVRGSSEGLEDERTARLEGFGDDPMRFLHIDRDRQPDLLYRGYGGTQLGLCPGAGTTDLCGGVFDASEVVESFAAGDVLGDLRPEIVVGAPRADGHGAVFVYSYSRGSVTEVAAVDQASPGVPGREQLRDVFGWSVEVADLGRGRKDDIVVGNPGERGGGSVTVLYGGRKGVAARGARVIHQGTRGVPDRPEPNDFFGAALTVLDHDGDRRLDLAIGAPDERNGRESEPSGRVTVVPGRARTRPFSFGLLDLGIEATGGAAFGRELGR